MYTPDKVRASVQKGCRLESRSFVESKLLQSSSRHAAHEQFSLAAPCCTPFTSAGPNLLLPCGTRRPRSAVQAFHVLKSRFPPPRRPCLKRRQDTRSSTMSSCPTCERCYQPAIPSPPRLEARWESGTGAPTCAHLVRAMRSRTGSAANECRKSALSQRV